MNNLQCVRESEGTETGRADQAGEIHKGSKTDEQPAGMTAELFYHIVTELSL